jgi:hypothetical protein
MKKKILNIIKRNAWVLIIFLILIFINYYLIFSLERAQAPKRGPQTDEMSVCVCPIEYGKPECMNSGLVIPFHNPNDFDLENVQVTAKTIKGSDIYNVDKPLNPKNVETLQLIQCYHVNDVRIRWCCNKTCCESELKDYSEDVKLEK